MRVRRVGEGGEYTIGQSNLLLVNSAEAVAQIINSRLALRTGEWFLDLSAGTPYQTEILGYGTEHTRDVALKERVLGTPGVLEITQFTSSLVDRNLSVQMVVHLDPAVVLPVSKQTAVPRYLVLDGTWLLDGTYTLDWVIQ